MSDDMDRLCRKLVGVLGEIHHASMLGVEQESPENAKLAKDYMADGGQLVARVEWREQENIIAVGIQLHKGDDSLTIFETSIPNPRAGMSGSIN